MSITTNVARTALKGVTFYNPSKASGGYTLFIPWAASPISSACVDAWLIDMEGYIVHRWQLPHEATLHGILQPDGHLIYAAKSKTLEEMGLPLEFAGNGNEIIELDWDGKVVRRVETPFQHHDFLILPNHHIMYLKDGDSKTILPDELTAKWKGGVPGSEYKGKIYSEDVCEIDQDGKLVWEWIGYEHCDPEIDAINPLASRSHWHFNTLWLCQGGNILISSRNTSEVLKIAYPSGEIIARYGKDKIFGQHDSKELDNGRILVFDNGVYRYGYGPSYSRVVEIDPDTDEIVWEYKAELPSDFYAGYQGGVERLPNGNTLVCSSVNGLLFEVTREGELVWEYASPFAGERIGRGIYGNTIFRAHRYTSDYPGLKGRDLDPARFPWENRLFGPGAFKKDFTPTIF